MRMVFKEIKTKRTKKGICKKCGKGYQLSKTFMQTLNPYNRDGNCNVKTLKQILIEIEREANEWDKLPITKHTCKLGGV